MQHDARSSYLEAQILTATPQKLRLMLVQGALRFARQAGGAFSQQELEQAIAATERCRSILVELLSGVRQDHSELAQQVLSIYQFLFQQLTFVQLKRDPTLLAGVIEVLEVEQDTWQQVCQQLGSAPPRPSSPPREIVASGTSPVRTSSGFSLHG